MRCRLSQAFAELTFHRLKVSAREKRLQRGALHTSIYPFIFSPVPPHAGWKMWQSASAAEEVKSVLPQSVTNASLDTWQGHSLLLSPGHSVPRSTTYSSQTHAFLHIHVLWLTRSSSYCTPPKHFRFIIGHSALLISQSAPWNLPSSGSDFWIATSFAILHTSNYSTCVGQQAVQHMDSLCTI